MSIFRKATREKVFLKLAITGPSGSGKTFSALRLAHGLVGPSGRVALIDTENGSASLYADRFDFDTVDIAPPYDHEKFIEAIDAAVAAGYGAAIIDSGSHFWEGILDYKSTLDSRPGSNSYTNWRQAGDRYSGILRAVLQSPIHVICCMRSKMDYIQETDERTGKKTVRKVGMAPIMRDGTEYEFTTVFDVALDHKAATSKDRSGLFTDQIFQITEETGRKLAEWRSSAKDPVWRTDLAEALSGSEEKAVEFLRSIGWLTAEQGLSDISREHATKITSNIAAFKAKLQ